MAKQKTLPDYLKDGSRIWNDLRKRGEVATDHTGATFVQLFSANADLSSLQLIGTEWDKCDLSRMNFRDADLSNAYFVGGRLQECDFRGANLEGATFESLKLFRCDFTGARGLEDLELDDVDTDRVVGLFGEPEEQRERPPAVGITSFTREQRERVLAQAQGTDGPPPFQPQDPPGALLFRGLKSLGAPPPWVLDVPGLNPPLPPKFVAGRNLESLCREAVKTRQENHKPVGDNAAVENARNVVAEGGNEVASAVLYLRELGHGVTPSEAAVARLIASFMAEVAEDDLTAPVDPRITGALLVLGARQEALDNLEVLRERLAAAQLFVALLEAGFAPDNNWEEAVDSSEAAVMLTQAASGGDRKVLQQAFETFVSLPEEVRLKRLGYLAEATAHVEQMLAPQANA